MRQTLVCAVTLCISLLANAETKVCMGGNLAQLSGSARRTCEDQVRMVQRSNAGVKAPDGWHFVVVCGEDGWKDYAAFSQQGESQLAGAAADTDFAGKTTFLRGTRLGTVEAAELVISRSLRSPSVDATQIATK